MNDSPDFDLPVAAKVRRELPESSEWFITYTSYGDSNFNPEKRNPDELVRKSDAEDAVVEARQQERQEILDQITEVCYGEISKLKSQIIEEDGKGTQSVKDLRHLEKSLDKKFDELRDELKGGSE